MKGMLWVLLLAVGAAAAWAQYYERLAPAQRRELAEAYYLVGRQYALQGDPDKAREYEGMARHIDPSLDPASIPPEPGSAAPEPGALPAAVPGREAGEAQAMLLKSRFLRLVSAFLAEDTRALLALMDGSVWFSRFQTELTQGAIAGDLESFFARANLSGGLAPSAVYDLDSLEVSPVEASAWGPCYAVRVTARADFSEAVAFWEKRQQYLYHPRDGQWLLFAVGSGMPPASWEPRAPQAPAATAAPAGAASELKSIREAFLASLRHFLAREPAEASRYFAGEILILRLNSTLTRAELASTFEGYFEGGDFGGVGAEQVVDTTSISVEPTGRFADRRPGPEYRLSVRTRLDLSDRIPFWTRFQEYYFSREEGDWRIFAIF